MSEPRVVHQWEQFGAHLREMARAFGSYREELEEAGFTRSEAVAPVAMLQGALTGSNKP